MRRFDLVDTICALATPTGPAARGLIRISGDRAWELVGLPPAGRTSRPRLRPLEFAVGPGPLAIPCEAAVWPAGRSYTGQPMVELHTFGSPPLLDALVGQLLARGARLAEPGEFTQRAVLAGRLDLTQAEAVLSVIDARSTAELEPALAQLAGGLRGPLLAVRDDLVASLAHLEAVLDFVDEPDVADLEHEAMAADLQRAADGLRGLLDSVQTRDQRLSAPRVVLTGPPNAGKSSLFNALIGGPEALVSDVAGTTRDSLLASLECDGLRVDLVDTAGADALATGSDALAQRERIRQVEQADLLLICEPVGGPSPVPCADRPGVNGLRVTTMADRARPAASGTIATSARTGEGLGALKRAIASELRRWDADGGRRGVLASLSRDEIARAVTSLDSALAGLALGCPEELIAIDLREAIDRLGTIAGEVTSEVILDQIFGRFCIGK